MIATISVGFVSFLLLLVTPLPASADQASFDKVGREFDQIALPLLRDYCQKCHSTKLQEGELDLERFTTFAQVQKDSAVWQKVGEMLDNGEMPPKTSKQPSQAERGELREWVRAYTDTEARAQAGDPGKVVLRRLNNAEYTYTIRDLTGVDKLNPAKEFPVDGAAGEGFTNTGNSLSMSPALVTKYLDAAKEIASHAVLLPNGFRFSPASTRRDWTEENLNAIREFYRQFSDSTGGDKVNLQGIVFDTNKGGRLPLEKYLLATIVERDTLEKGTKSIGQVATLRGLSPKYLGILWNSLISEQPSLLLDGLRERWKVAKVDDIAALSADVIAWQKGLWRFATVGHIGKVGGPKNWLEPISPLITRHEFRHKIPTSADGKDVVISLVARDAGDGNDQDYVVWEQPRIAAPGRPDLNLKDVREVAGRLGEIRERVLAHTEQYLKVSADVAGSQGEADLGELAAKQGLELDALKAWLDYLGIGSGGSVELKGHFTNKISNASGYDFIKGWGVPETPQFLANSSDQHVRIPGNMKPHSVAVHPSPTLRAAAGWKAPILGAMKIEGAVTHAHSECGNGVNWSLELRRGATRQRLASGVTQGGKEVKIPSVEHVKIQKGDLISLLIGPRDGNHSCDLTAIDLKITNLDGTQDWDLAGDVSGDVQAGNPHADKLGNADVWHFYTEPEKSKSDGEPVIPPGSLLAKWLATESLDEKAKLAERVQSLLTGLEKPANASPDDALAKQLRSLGGPILRNFITSSSNDKLASVTSDLGIDPSRFGKHPNGKLLDLKNLYVHAPSVVTIKLPAELVAGCELVATGLLEKETGFEGTVQLEIRDGEVAGTSGLRPSEVQTTMAGGAWTGDNRRTSYGTPILVNEGSQARKRVEASFDEFRQLFPAALCYTKIVPVDEVVTLTLYYREDDHLVRLMLDDVQAAKLDRLWDELHYISYDAFTLVDALAQLIEYATQDANPKVFEPLRKPYADRAEAFRQRLVATEPKHIEALIEFASRAYRRPLTDADIQHIHNLYRKLRDQELPHEEAFQLTLARILVTPAFLYRAEKPGPGNTQSPISNNELANRLSYFLWSSQPDRELRNLADSGKLTDPDVLVAQMRRMLKDEKVGRLSREFACQWLHIADFDQLDEKSERHFPSFLDLRGAMQQESIHFFTDLFQNNGSVLDILNADYTFVNEPLARHYGMPWGENKDWVKVAGVQKYGRGGVLGQASTLSKQSGASRTSPILRGNWISEVLLGERLPRPPKGVPQLPDDEAATEGKTVRQLVELHSNDPLCANCHKRIDPLGFALERYDAIGRIRDRDLGNRPIETKAKTLDGSEFDGFDGLRDYLSKTRKDAFLRQFSKKLLGYALGRSVQLSDEPLLTEMQSSLKSNDYRIVPVIELIVRSRQFREIRGRDTASND